MKDRVLLQVYVMGCITVLVRRPSLGLPVAEGDLEEQVGGLQSVGRVSAYHSESEFGSAPQGDPPHWAIQATSAHLPSFLLLLVKSVHLVYVRSALVHLAVLFVGGSDVLCHIERSINSKLTYMKRVLV